MSRHKGYHTNQLIFPSNWTGKWLYRAIVNTPKWQINSVLGSTKYGQWYGLLQANLNGLMLAPKTADPVSNVMRSVAVGIKVKQASTQYEKLMHKLPYEEEVKRLNELLENPIVGDMVKTLTEATLPAPMTGKVVSKRSVTLPPYEPGEEEEEEEYKVVYGGRGTKTEEKSQKKEIVPFAM